MAIPPASQAPALVAVRHTVSSNERCPVCWTGMSNKQRVVVSHQDPQNPNGPYIHPVHKKCLLQGIRINQLTKCYTCEVPLDIQTAFPPEQQRQFEMVIRPENAERINEYVRSLLLTVTPSLLEFGWALNELRISQQGNQANAPSLEEESWGTVAFWVLTLGYHAASQCQLKRDIAIGREDKALNGLRDITTGGTAVWLGLRSPTRIALVGSFVILPQLGQLMPFENVRNVSRLAWNAIKQGTRILAPELAVGAVAGLVARIVLSPVEDALPPNVLISGFLVSVMATLALQEAYKRTNR